jgi:predicted MPP superfamily phosphohydrolase
MTRRRLLIGLAAAAAGGAGVLMRSRIRLTRHVVPWTTRRTFRIVHLTDIHVGWTTPEALLDEAASTARSLKPDLVVLTGDYVNRSLHEIGALEQWIERLPRPCVATLGNHDHWSGPREIKAMFGRAGVRVLTNEPLIHEGIQIAGLDDARTRHLDLEPAFHGLDPQQRILALQHCPGAAEQIAEQGASLILSGHTHAGQIAIPRVTSALFARLGQPYAAGEYRLDACRLYVNAGLGHSRRIFRHGARAKPEIAVFDLVPEVA